MARDINGNYTLPAGNPVQPDTEIQSAGWANPTLADIASALTDSLSRTGQGGMLAPFKNADGAISSPGDSWTNEPTSGWYRKALHEFWFAVQGVDVFGVAPDGIHLGAGLAADFIHTIATNWGIAAGSANAYTVAMDPPNTLLVDGMLVSARNLTDNTTINPTLNVDNLGAFPITRRGGQPLQAGDLGPARTENQFRLNLTFNRWELMTAQFPVFTLPTVRLISNTGSYTPSPNMRWCLVEIIGGGGGGSAGGGSAGGSGGGSGGYARRFFYAQQVVGPQTCLIGGGSGGVGGTTTFGTVPFMSATGGSPGVANGLGGTGGNTSGTLIDGEYGQNGHAGSANVGGNGANSKFAPGGKGSNGAVAGENGYSYGAGGGGSGPSSSQPSSGYSGVIKITEFYL